MVRRRSACLLLSITTAVRRDRPTGDRATERHKVFAADRRGSEARNLRPLKFASGLDPDEKLEAIEDAGPAALRQRPFDLPTADCRPKGLSVMESQISKVYAPSNATGRQLTITKIAHKATVIGDLRVRAVLAAHDMAAKSCRAAALDRRHHLQLAETDVTCIGLPPSRSMVAEDSPLHPVIARLERSADIQKNDNSEQRLEKLKSLLSPSGPSPLEISLISDLLSSSGTSVNSEAQISPQKRKEMTLAALGPQLDAW